MDSTPSLNPPANSRSPKALWGVIGALSVAVAALGGTLLYQQQKQPPVAVAMAPSPVQAPADFKPEAMAPAPADGVPPPAGPAPLAAMPSPQPVRAAAAPAPQLAPAPAMSAPPVARAAAPVCKVCGHVESVRAVKRTQPTSGVGIVAGGVVGGLVGNQFGHGRGRTATTVLGAVGGGFAGNAIEKHVRAVTVYEVAVRMEDGSLRTVETQSAPPIGKAVTLKGRQLRPVDGHK